MSVRHAASMLRAVPARWARPRVSAAQASRWLLLAGRAGLAAGETRYGRTRWVGARSSPGFNAIFCVAVYESVSERAVVQDGGEQSWRTMGGKSAVAMIRSKERELLRASGPGSEDVAGVVPIAAGGRLLFCLSLALGEECSSGQWHQWQRPLPAWVLTGPDELPADAYGRGSDPGPVINDWTLKQGSGIKPAAVHSRTRTLPGMRTRSPRGSTRSAPRSSAPTPTTTGRSCSSGWPSRPAVSPSSRRVRPPRWSSRSASTAARTPCATPRRPSRRASSPVAASRCSEGCGPVRGPHRLLQRPGR